MSGYNAVTLTSTGQILRVGRSPFNTDGTFDGGIHTYHADLTNKLLAGIPVQHLKVVGSVITEMTGPEKTAVDDSELRLTFLDGIISGLKVTYSSASLVIVTKGYCRDSENKENMFLVAGADIDFTVTGSAGGLQVAEAISTFYNCFLIGDSTGAADTNVWAVPQGTAIVLPGTFDHYRYIGSVRNDASGNIINFICSGDGKQRKLQYRDSSSSLEVFDGSGTANVFTSLDISSLVPIGTDFIDLQVHFDMDSDSDKLFLQSGINPQTTANSLIKYGSGLSTEDFQFYDFQVWGLAIDPATPSFEYGTSQVGQDLKLAIIGYLVNL